MYKLLLMVAAGAAALWIAGILSAQDARLKPTHGVVVANGKLRGKEIMLTAGGPIATNKGGIKAWIAKAPHVQLNVPQLEENEEGRGVTITAEAGREATLLLLFPTGKWLATANDDRPKFEFKNLPPGRYLLWVGTVDKGPRGTKAKLIVKDDFSAD